MICVPTCANKSTTISVRYIFTVYTSYGLAKNLDVGTGVRPDNRTVSISEMSLVK